MSTTAGPIDRLRELGGELFLSGNRLRYRIPAEDPEARQLLDEIRQNRDAIVAMLRDLESRPPLLDEVAAMLPPGVHVLRYKPRAVPFEVSPVSIVTNAGKFFRYYLACLAWRAGHPNAVCSPVEDILTKLADAGLSLTTDGESFESPGVRGVRL